jgi:transposase
MAVKEISWQQTKAYRTIKAHKDEWLTVSELAKKAGISIRATRVYLSQWRDEGLAEIRNTWPNRYRLAKTPPKDLVRELERASEVFRDTLAAGESGVGNG